MSAANAVSPVRSRPGLWSRLLAAACYCGLAPALLPFPRLRQNPFLAHHLGRGAVTFLYLLVVLLLGLVGLGVLTYLLIYDPAYGHAPEEKIVFHFGLALIPPALVAGTAWLLGVIVALCGSTWDVLLVGPVARRRFGVRLALTAGVLTWVGVVLLGALAWHACALARDEGPAPVYVLVDKLGAEKYIPQWAVKLAAYRLSLAATARWGSGSIVVAPLNERSLREAMAHGRLVMLWCHGSSGRFSMPDGYVGATPFFGPLPGRCLYLWRPDPATGIDLEDTIPLGEELQYVYCSACNAGEAAPAWQERLAPAQIVTFNRISGGLEHVFWVWFDAPALLPAIR